MQFNVYMKSDGSFYDQIEAESPQEVLRIVANLSPDCGEYGLDSASMQFSVINVDNEERSCIYCTHYDGDACKVLGREDASTCPSYDLDKTIEFIEDME